MNTEEQTALSDLPEEIRFTPALTFEQVQQNEARQMTGNVGINRRIAFLVLTKSSAEVLKLFLDAEEDEGAAKAATALLDGVEAYQSYLKATLELVDSAHARLLLVGTYLYPEPRDKWRAPGRELADEEEMQP